MGEIHRYQDFFAYQGETAQIRTFTTPRIDDGPNTL